jgi:hypothetical protein
MADSVISYGLDSTIYPPTMQDKLPLYRWERYCVQFPAAHRGSNAPPPSNDRLRSDVDRAFGQRFVSGGPTSCMMIWLEPVPPVHETGIQK